MFSNGVFEAAGGLGVAVHRIADPEHLLARFANRLDHLRQAFSTSFAPKRWMMVRRPGVFCGFSVVTALQPFGGHGRADLHAHGIGDAAEEFHVRAIDAAVRMPIHGMCVDQVVPALLALDVTRLRLLVGMSRPSCAAKIDRGDFVRRASR